jgi:pyridoxal phosphate enzyme (YggS family)
MAELSAPAAGPSGDGRADGRLVAFAERLAAVRARIADVAGPGARVRIVAVTKGFGPDEVAVAAAAGVADLGENYAQELLAKATTAPSGCRWHFLSPPQRNKVARLAPVVELWHAVDRSAAADAIARHRRGARVLIQLNAVGDPARPGCSEADLPALVEHCRHAGLAVEGLMAVGPLGDRDGARIAFGRVAALAGRLGLTELSMGMSDDFDLAVREGSTMVRLGRALFGPRPGRAVAGR